MKAHSSRIDNFRSLRWRLLAAVSAAVMLIWVTTGYLSYTKAQHEAEELMDGNLAQSARILLALAQDDEAEMADLERRLSTVQGGDSADVYEPPLEFQIGYQHGRVLARSANAPSLPILGVVGYSDIRRRDDSWRVLNVESVDGRYRVQVVQSIDLRDKAALEVASQTVLPLIVIVPLLAGLIYLSIRGGLQPLDRLAHEVAARSPDNLSPLAATDIPTEARPLVGALNRLLQRVRRALDNERRFTADAAHELRTPLAALKVHTQVAQLSPDEETRSKALRQLQHGIDRATHLVDQLLRLARLDPLQGLPNRKPFALKTLLRDTTNAVMTAHNGKSRQLAEQIPPGDLMLIGDGDLLGVALRNLLDNAFRYSRDGDQIVISANTSGSRASIEIRDTGPGADDATVARLGERFYRHDDAGSEGNGLGLAIAIRIVALHDATLKLGNHPQGGFVARIDGLQIDDGGVQEPAETTAGA